MKEYIIDKIDKKNYITKFRREKDGSISVEFADGRIFQNLDYCEENFQKLISKQEEQAKRGLDHYSTFKARLNRSKAATALSFATTLGLSIGATNMVPAISQAVDKSNPLVVCLGIGALTVLGTIPAYAKLYRDSKIVEELDKIKYRDTHKKKLDSIKDYPNSLAGIDKSKAAWMSRRTNPFGVENIDRFEIEDLQTIVDNIDNEKQFCFTYTKSKNI